MQSFQVWECLPNILNSVQVYLLDGVLVVVLMVALVVVVLVVDEIPSLLAVEVKEF